MALAALRVQSLKFGLMRRVGECQPAGEHPAVPAGQLAGVEDDRRDVGLGDSDLDAAAGEDGSIE